MHKKRGKDKHIKHIHFSPFFPPFLSRPAAEGGRAWRLSAKFRPGGHLTPEDAPFFFSTHLFLRSIHLFLSSIRSLPFGSHFLPPFRPFLFFSPYSFPHSIHLFLTPSVSSTPGLLPPICLSSRRLFTPGRSLSPRRFFCRFFFFFLLLPEGSWRGWGVMVEVEEERKIKRKIMTGGRQAGKGGEYEMGIKKEKKKEKK